MRITRGRSRILATLTAMAVGLTAPMAEATNGYFKIGYGSKARGLAGSGVALPQDSLAPALNPAGLTKVGTRLDAGLEFFSPIRQGALDATFLGGASSSADSGANMFAVPHGGVSYDMGNGISLGFSITANGGMNTRYDTNVYTDAFAPAIGVTSSFPGGPSGFAGGLEGAGIPTAVIDPILIGLGMNPNLNPSLGVNLAQAIMAPTIAYQVTENHSFGLSALIGYQQFRAYGLGLFQGISSDPANVTNRGNDSSWGAGVRIGWLGQLTDNFSFGASASSKIYMSEFEKYKGLFAEQGDFDIPANVTVGLAIKATPRVTLTLDAQRIFYGDVKSISNKGPTAEELFNDLAGILSGGLATPEGRPGGPADKRLGNDNGYGFGWNDIWVFKAGVQYEYSDKWTLRGGFNYGENPIDADQNLFNIIAPGVVQAHLTAGFTYMPTKKDEITFAYMHAFKQDQSFTYSAANPLGPVPPSLSYTADTGMYQNSVEVSYGRRF